MPEGEFRCSGVQGGVVPEANEYFDSKLLKTIPPIFSNFLLVHQRTTCRLGVND